MFSKIVNKAPIGRYAFDRIHNRFLSIPQHDIRDVMGGALDTSPFVLSQVRPFSGALFFAFFYRFQLELSFVSTNSFCAVALPKTAKTKICTGKDSNLTQNERASIQCATHHITDFMLRNRQKPIMNAIKCVSPYGGFSSTF